MASTKARLLKHDFPVHGVAPENSRGINCVILTGPMVCNLSLHRLIKCAYLGKHDCHGCICTSPNQMGTFNRRQNPGAFLGTMAKETKNPSLAPSGPTFPREARDLISKIRSCTVRSDLKNKQKTAENALFLRSDLTVQDRILEIRSLASLALSGFRWLKVA